MPTETSVLFAYYVCDAIAQRGPLSDTEARACAAAYRAVKIAHLTPVERTMLEGEAASRAEALELGHRRFVSWTERHPEKVAALRSAAALGQSLAAE